MKRGIFSWRGFAPEGGDGKEALIDAYGLAGGERHGRGQRGGIVGVGTQVAEGRLDVTGAKAVARLETCAALSGVSEFKSMATSPTTSELIRFMSGTVVVPVSVRRGGL